VFGSIGVPELVLIFIVALLLFGPRKLPEIGRTVGKALGEFRRASNDLKRTIEEEVASDELRSVSRDLREVTSTPPSLGGEPGPSGPENDVVSNHKDVPEAPAAEVAVESEPVETEGAQEERT
jgi:sec-independent protein translocase protein TatA